MKVTSIVFLVISILLVIGGSVVLNKSVEMADEKNIDLFKQTLRDNGDLVETIELSDENTSKININLKNTDINIIGNSEKSYVEVINFNAIEYSTYNNNRTFNIENDLISAVIGRAEGGSIQFDGVRDYLRNDEYNKNEKRVNIYLSSQCVVKIFDINIENGNVTVENLDWLCDFYSVINEGSFACKNTPKISFVKAQIKKGDVRLDKAYVANADINIENGNIEFSTPDSYVYDYNIESETGKIKYNDETHSGKFTMEHEDINAYFEAHVGVGNVTITTFEAPAEQPEETEKADETLEETSNE